MKLKIDLSSGPGSMNCAPCCIDDVWYPNINLRRDDELEIPDSGELTVTFKVTSKTVREQDGKKCYEYTLKLGEILGAKKGEVTFKAAEPKKDSYKEREGIIDALRDSMADEEDD
jgi:hypothetical protein